MAMKLKVSLSVVATTSMALGLLTLSSIEAQASYSIYVGKNLTKDGSVLIGGSGDARTELLYGLRAPETDETSLLKSQMVRCD
jgi:hypothetical protein